MKALDLFTGIGGFPLGLERVGISAQAFVEQDPACCRVLRRHWPYVPIYGDIHDVTGKEADLDPTPDIITGGPPCQQTSVAAAIQGRRTGETLWPQMARLVGAVRPRWVVVEQPAGNARWEGEVAMDLAGLGYASTLLQQAAGDFGAPHQRRRVFIVANAVRERCEEVARLARSPQTPTKPWPAPPRGTWRTPGAGNSRMDDGLPGWMDRIRMLGNAVCPVHAEALGRAIIAVDDAWERHHDHDR